MSPRLGYWSVRGAAQPIRSLIEYTGEEYEDKLYHLDFTGPEIRKDFYKEKNELGLDFPNLPYYIDGDLKMTGSTAIAKHIARKHGLEGKTELEKVQVDMLQQVAYDINWTEFLPIIFRNMADKTALKAELEVYVNGPLPVHFEKLSKFLGNKKFFTGDNVTYVDFYVYELFLNFSYIASDLMNKYSNIKNFQQRIEALPAIAKYMKTEKYMTYFEKPMIALFSE